MLMLRLCSLSLSFASSLLLYLFLSLSQAYYSYVHFSLLSSLPLSPLAFMQIIFFLLGELSMIDSSRKITIKEDRSIVSNRFWRYFISFSFLTFSYISKFFFISHFFLYLSLSFFLLLPFSYLEFLSLTLLYVFRSRFSSPPFGSLSLYLSFSLINNPNINHTMCKIIEYISVNKWHTYRSAAYANPRMPYIKMILLYTQRYFSVCLSVCLLLFAY